jgi:hypothetical protein
MTGIKSFGFRNTIPTLRISGAVSREGGEWLPQTNKIPPPLKKGKMHTQPQNAISTPLRAAHSFPTNKATPAHMLKLLTPSPPHEKS